MTTEWPPGARTPLWQPVNDAAVNKEFVLQVCSACRTLQYPPREVCERCLHHELLWETADPAGTVLAHTALHTSIEPYFRDRAPWPIATVKLDSGPVIVAHLADDCQEIGKRVRLLNRLDISAAAVFIAIAEDAKDAKLDKQLRELVGEA